MPRYILTKMLQGKHYKYKAVLLLLLSPLLVITVSGQIPTASRNYVKTTTVKASGKTIASQLAGLPVESANQSVQYLDGLGRSLQTVEWQGSPTKKDIVQFMEYDAFGREVKKYLPYAEQSGNDATYKTGALTAQSNYYGTSSWDATVAKTPNPYSLSVLEASPLNRVTEQGALGASWQPVAGSTAGHTVKIESTSNIASEVLLWTVNSNGATAGTNTYLAGKLYKTISKDENWVSGKSGIVEEFKNLQGQVILKKIWESETASLSTHYIYDDLGNLRYVVPPAVTATSFTEGDPVFDHFIYAYRYDGRKRLIEKKVPGKGWEEMVYNPIDQAVFTRDAVERSLALRHFTKYDALGRVVMTGIESGHGADRATLQAVVNTLTPLWETRSNGAGNLFGYDNLSCPSNAVNMAVETVNYYDSYDFPGYGSDYFPSVATSGMVRGLQTASRVRVLGTATMLLTVMHYDPDGRLVETISDNHLGGKGRVVNTYSFDGSLKNSIRTHVVGGATTTIANSYTYDHMGRKISTTENINSQGEVTLNRLVYNEIGQLVKKSLHGTDTTFLQHSYLSYNERGWMKTSTSAQFRMQLDYQDGTYPQYNGNISNQRWGSSLGNVFTYQYDKLNRLYNATSTGISMSEALTYDVMGNITSLNRDGNQGTYGYAGNQLQQLAGSPSLWGGLGGAYDYDANGNATTDGRNGMTLAYNHLNLPITASKSGLSLAYTYDATGQKLRKHSIGGSTVTTDYVDGIQYTNNVIDFIQTEEGRAVRDNSGTYKYEYNLTDHLGNVRYSFDIYGGAVRKLQEDNYYAFGLRNSASAGTNNYLYNGKELQDELGQYDYGARFYDPVIGRWNVIDNKSELYFQITPYAYAANTPINAIDPDGNLVIFIAGQNTGDGGTSGYWRSRGSYKDKILFNQAFTNHFLDGHEIYIDGASGGWLNTISAPSNPFLSSNLDVDNRISAGRALGKFGAKDIINSLKRTNGVITESIKVVAHSMGAAYAKGLILEIVEYAKAHPEECQGLSITEYDFAAFQQNKLSAVPGVPLYQFDNEGDSVVDGIFGSLTGSNHATQKGAKEHKKDVNPKGGHSIFDFISVISNLEEGNYKFIDGKFVKQN